MSKLIAVEAIKEKIFFIRGKKVMLDKDLADLYGVPTKRLKEQVKRNIQRFPEDFMFEFSEDEMRDWRSQFATSKKERIGIRRHFLAFTEHGIAMLLTANGPFK